MPKVIVDAIPDSPVTPMSGGYIKQLSHNPVDGGSFMSVGKSHGRGGMLVDSDGDGKPNAEIEGGETIHRSPVDNAAVVGGNLYIPGTKTKFKTAFKRIAEEEDKADKTITRSQKIMDKSSTEDKFGVLAINAANVMTGSATSRQMKLAGTKEELSQQQQTIHEIAEVTGMKPKEVVSKMHFGGRMPPGKLPPQSKWQFNGTNYEGVDEKIKGFVQLLDKYNLSGYSGPNSGVDQRNTKSGRLSRHSKGQALDMFFKDKDAYNTILNNPELAGYLYQNGLTVINEYDSNVASKTGATAGHLHIGYDRGTSTADAFRRAAQTKYPNWSNAPGVPFKGNNAAQLGLPVGDGQNVLRMPTPSIEEDNKNLVYAPPTGSATPNIVMDYPERRQGIPPGYSQTPTPGNFQGPITNKKLPSLADRNKLPFSQLLPEMMALGERPDFVQRQQYTPTLYQPYQVSFQDRLNENNASFRAMQQSLVNNPEAQAILAAQKYNADNQVSAEQFRTNQGLANQVTNQNTELINQARLQNLQLNDQQFVRQTQARENTRANKRAAASSIVGKVAANRAENNNIRLTENMFQYRPDQNLNMQYIGNPYQFNINGTIPGQYPIPYNPNEEITTRETIDEEGNRVITNTKKLRAQGRTMNRFWGGKLK